MSTVTTQPDAIKAAVINVWNPRDSRKAGVSMRTPEDALAEAVSLAQAIDLQVELSTTLRMTKPQPATLLGSGQVEALHAQATALGISLFVINHPLSPVQQRNLEQGLKAKVIDRTGLILEIFGARARTAEGKLQVELAALDFQRSRLVRSWTHLERQRGGFGFLGGPGESQLEIDRRLIEDRIIRIRKDLDKVRQNRDLQREARKASEIATIALVGYTNAGKSTLFNKLTGADVLAKDMLFATLDPTLRQLELPSGREVVLSDTVGFISDLPHQLVDAFRATLEEVSSADIILHVRDAVSEESDVQKRDVLATLAEMDIDAHDPRLIEVLNKVDLLPQDEKAALLVQRRSGGDVPSVGVSAISGEGCDSLLELIERKLSEGREIMDVSLEPQQGDLLAWVHQHGQILSRKDDEETGSVRLRLSLSAANAGRLRQKLGLSVPQVD